MFQIDNPSAAAAQPASSAPGVAGFFTDGNPAGNVPATIVPAEWLNATMLEIINAITGTGQTLNKASFNQLLTAIQTLSKNPGVTPPQFDNSTKTATTAFVKAAGFEFPNIGGYGFNVATTLTASQLNNWGQFQSALTVTLPALSAAPLGTTFTFLGGPSGGTVKGNGTDQIQSSANTLANTLYVASGECLTVAQNSQYWYVVHDGFGSPSFGASIANPGYQKLPTGLIMQWGNGTYTAQATTVGTFPLAFPNNCIEMYVSLGYNLTLTNNSVGIGSQAISKAQFNLTIASTGAGSTGAAWMALGF